MQTIIRINFTLLIFKNAIIVTVQIITKNSISVESHIQSVPCTNYSCPHQWLVEEAEAALQCPVHTWNTVMINLTVKPLMIVTNLYNSNKIHNKVSETSGTETNRE